MQVELNFEAPKSITAGTIRQLLRDTFRGSVSAPHALRLRRGRSADGRGCSNWIAALDVAEMDAEAAIHGLSETLGEDCIAVYYPARKSGALIGPRAEAWGEFNFAFFTRF